MKSILKLDIKYAASQIFYYGAFCVITGYASVYLLDQHFSNSMIGVVLALCNILAVIFQPLLASLITGYAVEGFSAKILPLFYIVINTFLFVIVWNFTLPKKIDAEKLKVQRQKTDTIQLSLLQFCFKYKKFMAFLFGFIWIYFAHTIINYFCIQMITNIGGTSSDMGNAVFLAAMLELPTMLLFTRISNKVNCGTLLRFSVIMFTIKHILAYFATNMMMIYLSQAMQSVAYALFIPASVYYVNKKIADSDQVKGQSMITMAMTVAGVFASLIVSVIGMIISYIMVEKV